ncbi:MAG: RNA polymerase sigma factor [Thermoanaerobaculia bacterium]
MLAAQRFGANEADAEDVAQEALVRLLPVVSYVDRLESWLYIVVRNLVRRQGRRRSKRARACSELAPAVVENTSPEESWLAKLEIERLVQASSPGCRHLLELTLDGYRHREIAVLLGCEVHQVGPRLRRALQTSRRRLSNEL